MLLFEKHSREQGYILLLTLIFLSVLLLLVMNASDNSILNRKMQTNSDHASSVFNRAQLGLMQMIMDHAGESISLPDASITLTTSETLVQTDACGNQTVDLQATADDGISTVVLNTRDIFAKVPREKNCAKIPWHQIIWWRAQ